MKKFVFAGAAVVAVAIAAYLGTTETQSQETTAPAESGALVAVTLPETLSEQAQTGKLAFDAVCAACHGVNGSGKDGFGPPLIHKIYEPSHHGDMSFFMAVQNGVRAHHWRFGDMPAQDGLTRGDVSNIIAYVREVQRANGIN
jgi:mono/diheme cytochrome c family protein